MTELASAYVTLIPTLKGAQQQVARELDGVTDRAGHEGGRKLGAGLTAGLKSSIIGAGAIIGGGLVGGFIKDSIGQASDLNEAGTKLNAIFGDASKQVQDFAKAGPKALGQNRLAILDSAAAFGTFGKAAGLSGKDLAGFSTGFAGLSTDLASFFNTNPADAAEAISAGLRGEAEPLRRYGVLLDDATLRNEALKLGLIKTTKEALTPQQKVLAAQAVIYKQTKDAQGDFARTSGGLANQQRILSAQFTDLKGKIGDALLPVMVTLVTFLTTHLPQAFGVVEKIIGKVKDAFAGGGGLSPAVASTRNYIQTAVIPTLRALGGFVQANILPILHRLAVFFTTTLLPAVQKIAGIALGALREGLAKVSEKLRENRPQLEKLGNVLLTVAGFIVKHVLPIVARLSAVLYGQLFTAIGVGITVIGGIVTAIQKIVDVVQAAIDKIRGLIKAVKDIPGSGVVGKIGGVVGHIPGFAGGGRYGPGPIVVGEYGPELLIPDTAGQVLTARQTREAFDASRAEERGHRVQQQNTFVGVTPEYALAESNRQLLFALGGTR